MDRLRKAVPLFVLAVIIAMIFLIISAVGNFFYLFERVEEQEIGVQFKQGRIEEIVDPGVYSDFGLFVELDRISTQAIPFESRDEEMITKDKQRIGLVVTGDIFRPTDKPTIENKWSQYRGVYLSDEQAVTSVKNFARQSMKVCVGDRSFDDNIIGTGRDELRNCVDVQINGLAEELGLRIENLVVPEVILSPEVQAGLDAIVQSRLQEEKAVQDEQRALAEAAAEQAKQEGEIRVAQSRIQEETKQQTTLAQLEQERLAAQLVVIEAQRANELANLETERQLIESRKANELLEAEAEIAISEQRTAAAEIQAKGATATELVLAEIYADNPEYAQYLMAKANASALNESDKLIFTAEGTAPSIVIPGPGIMPTIDSTP